MSGSTPEQGSGPGESPDARLVQAALAGHRASVEALADRLARIPTFLGAIDRRRGGRLSSHDLDDLSQDVVIRVWDKLPAFHGRGSLDNWVFRFALLEYLNRVRTFSRAPRQAPVTSELPERRAPATPGLEELALHLGQIPIQEAEVIERHHFDGANFAAIGEDLGIPRGTAKTRYYRGLLRLRDRLKLAVPEEWT